MTDYYLMAEVFVERRLKTRFENAMHTFLKLGGFREIDPRFQHLLVLGVRSPTHFDFVPHGRFQGPKGTFSARDRDGAQGKSAYRYLHLWNIPRLRDLDLATVMEQCADYKPYMTIDGFVAEEVQNVVYRVRWFSTTEPVIDLTNPNFVRVTRQFLSKDLGNYLFNVAALFPAAEAAGWKIVGHFQNVTGTLNTVTELWQPPTKLAAAYKLGILADAFSLKLDPAARKLFIEPYKNLPRLDIRDSFHATDYFLEDAQRRIAAAPKRTPKPKSPKEKTPKPKPTKSRVDDAAQ